MGVHNKDKDGRGGAGGVDDCGDDEQPRGAQGIEEGLGLDNGQSGLDCICVEGS